MDRTSDTSYKGSLCPGEYEYFQRDRPPRISSSLSLPLSNLFQPHVVSRANRHSSTWSCFNKSPRLSPSLPLSAQLCRLAEAIPPSCFFFVNKPRNGRTRRRSAHFRGTYTALDFSRRPRRDYNYANALLRGRRERATDVWNGSPSGKSISPAANERASTTTAAVLFPFRARARREAIEYKVGSL